MLTWDAEEALKKFTSGTSLRALGKLYGISHEAVRQKLSGKLNSVTHKAITCKNCNKPIQIAIGTNRKYCKQCAAEIRRRINAHDLCKCGNTKHKKSAQCMHCTRKFSHDLANQLIDEQYTVKSIARLFSVTPGAIYKANKHVQE